MCSLFAACFRGGATSSHPYHSCTPVPLRTGQAAFPHPAPRYVIRFVLSVSDPLPLCTHLLHGASVSLSRATYRGDLRSAIITRFNARPWRLSGPHHSRRGHPWPSFYIGPGTRVLPLRSIPRGLLARRSPGYLPAVVQLDAVFDPGVSAPCSSLSHSPHGLRLFGGDRPFPKTSFSRGYVSDSGLHPSPRCSRLSSFPAPAFSHYATGRLTNLTQEGLCA